MEALHVTLAAALLAACSSTSDGGQHGSPAAMPDEAPVLDDYDEPGPEDPHVGVILIAAMADDGSGRVNSGQGTLIGKERHESLSGYATVATGRVRPEAATLEVFFGGTQLWTDGYDSGLVAWSQSMGTELPELHLGPRTAHVYVIRFHLNGRIEFKFASLSVGEGPGEVPGPREVAEPTAGALALGEFFAEPILDEKAELLRALRQMMTLEQFTRFCAENLRLLIGAPEQLAALLMPAYDREVWSRPEYDRDGMFSRLLTIEDVPESEMQPFFDDVSGVAGVVLQPARRIEIRRTLENKESDDRYTLFALTSAPEIRPTIELAHATPELAASARESGFEPVVIRGLEGVRSSAEGQGGVLLAVGVSAVVGVEGTLPVEELEEILRGSDALIEFLSEG